MHNKINRNGYEWFKRALDIVCAFAGIVGTSPLWIIVCIGIECSDPGPIFYRAQRVGENNSVFSMFKFRSMRVDRNANENCFKADTDRIFPFGKVIRNLKLDELPQLINILKGDMSIVGPRPASVDQVKMVRSGANAVVSTVRPGLTGPSAIYDYIYGDTVEDEEEYRKIVLPDRLELDLYYISHHSLTYDVKMVWYTIICIVNSICGKSSERLLTEMRECAEFSRSERAAL